MKRLLVLAFIVSSIIATVILFNAINHNTMEVFCKDIDTNECSFDYSYAAFIWLIWFIPAFVIQMPIYWLVFFIAKRLNDRKLKP